MPALHDQGLTWGFWLLAALAWGLFLVCTVFEVAFAVFSPARLCDLEAWRETTDVLGRYLEKRERMRLTWVGGWLASSVGLSVVVSFAAWEAAGEVTSRGAGLALLVAFVMTLLSLMVARVLGRAVGAGFAECIVSRTIAAMYPVSVVCEPFLRLRTWLDHVLSARNRSASDELADEIRSVVEEGEDGGPLKEAEREMIESIIEFRNVEVREIMTPRTEIVGIEVSTPLEEARRFAAEQGHTRLPVFQKNLDNVVGVLNVKDLIGRIGRPGWETAQLKDVMRKPRFVPETKKIHELFEELRAQKTHMGIVVDEYGGTAGIVTIEDIIEEIVGEIQDEYDEEHKEPIEPIDATTIEVDAKVRVSELNDALPLDIPEDGDFDTVGGFVFSQLGRIPRVGERFEYGNAEIIVLAATERRVVRLLVKGRKSMGPVEAP